MRIARCQRQTVFKSNSSDPNIILWNWFSFSRQISFDSAIEMSGALIRSQDGTYLKKVLNLLYSFDLKSRVIGPIEEFAQGCHRQIKVPACLNFWTIEGSLWR